MDIQFEYVADTEGHSVLTADEEYGRVTIEITNQDGFIDGNDLMKLGRDYEKIGQEFFKLAQLSREKAAAMYARERGNIITAKRIEAAIDLKFKDLDSRFRW